MTMEMVSDWALEAPPGTGSGPEQELADLRGTDELQGHW